jgi:hypothetical protein
MMFKTIVTLSFLVASVSAGHAARDCNVPSIRLLRDVTANGYMYVKKDKTCAIQSADSPGGNTGVEITRQPSNGRLQVNGFKIAYTPRGGFVGKDNFGYVRNALDPRTGMPVRLPVDVEVTVEP